MDNNLPRTEKGRFIKGVCYSPETTFKPSGESWNRGLKFPGTGNSASFEKGHKPHNTLYDNAITTRKNNQGREYAYIRLAEGNWEFLQKWRWMNEIGPIPEGMLLRCKNDDTLNCDPSNWELMTRAENARVNRSQYKPRTATCAICAKEFKGYSRNAKYCSKECRKAGNLSLTKKYQAEHTPKIILTPRSCLVCDILFTPQHNLQKICSAECRKDKQRQYNHRYKLKHPHVFTARSSSNLTTKVKECIICGNAFTPSSNVQKTCSDSCRTIRAKQYKADHTAKKRIEKNCSRCGSKFIPVPTHRQICEDCRNRKPRKVTCIQCGTVFTKSGRGAQLLCSDECKNARKNFLRAKYGLKNRKPAPLVKTTCKVCGSEFTGNIGSRYCSPECKKQGKLITTRKHRDIEREQRLATPKQPVKCTCAQCGQEFESSRKKRYCSRECQLEVKRIKAEVYNRTKAKLRPPKPLKIKAPKPIPEPAPQRKPKRNQKAEREAALNMLELNRNAPAHDGEIIKAKNIVSPDLSKMEYRIYDPKMKQTFFFRTEAKYLNYLNKMKK